MDVSFSFFRRGGFWISTMTAGLIASLALGCGARAAIDPGGPSGTAGSGSGGAEPDPDICATYCAAVDAADCPMEIGGDACATQCEQSLLLLPSSCTSAFEALLSCVAGTFLEKGCDTAAGCEQSLTDYFECAQPTGN